MSDSLGFDPEGKLVTNKPWIGVALWIRSLPPNQPYRTFDSEFVVAVYGVEPDSPSEIAGIRVGDLVCAIDGVPVGSVDQAIDSLRSKSIGQKVTVSLMRDGAKTFVEVTIGTKPKGDFVN